MYKNGRVCPTSFPGWRAFEQRPPPPVLGLALLLSSTWTRRRRRDNWIRTKWLPFDTFTFWQEMKLIFLHHGSFEDACSLVELDNVRVLNSSSLSSLSSSSAKFPAITPQPKYSIKLPSQSIYRQLSRGLSCWTGDEIELLAKGQPDRIPVHNTSPSDATTLSRWWFVDRWWWWGEQCLIVLSGAGESLHPTA